MTIDTTFLKRCLDTPESALQKIARHSPDSIACDIYRTAGRQGVRFGVGAKR